MRYRPRPLQDPLTRALLDSQPHGIMVLGLEDRDDDESLILVTANAAADRLFQIDSTEMVGRRLVSLRPRVRETGVIAPLAQLAREGGALEMPPIPFNYEGGEVRWYSCQMSGLPGARVGLTFDDITERRRMEREAGDQRRFLDSIVENLPAMIFVKEAEKLRFVRVNRAGERITGISREALLGHTDYDFFPVEEADFFTAKDRAVLATGELEDILEEPLHTPEGLRWLHTKKIPIHDDDGRPAFLLGISEDITEVRQARLSLERTTEELRRSNEELERFAYVASHDLKEPLRTMSGFAELMRRRYAGRLDDRADRWLAHIIDGSSRMHVLIDDLLRYSKTGREELTMTPVDTAALVDDITDALGAAIEEAGARLTRGALPTVLGSRSLLRQLFQNLIGNALKFRAERPPVVEVSAAREGRDWVFTVRDNGVGIAPRHLDLIFGLFQRLAGRDVPGSGLGLAISRRIVERHGGRIRVTSTPGEGAAFHFNLPAATPLSEPSGEDAPPTSVL